MQTYHKIQSIFKRDPDDNYKTFLHGEWSVEAFGVLQDIVWTFTEKIDGTNIRIGWDDVAREVTFGGRSDNAQIPGQLATYMARKFTPSFLAYNLTGPVTLIGEGYGGKIQKGSSYQQEQRFILFDVFVEPYADCLTGIWLDRKVVQSIAWKLGIPTVPIVHKGPLLDGLNLCKMGMISRVSEDRSLFAEGVVARPEVELRDRMGRRIITKIKVKDFPK